MIDWIKAEIPFDWDEPIVGGHLLRISPDGELERQTPMTAHIRGSHDEHFTLRTVERGMLEIDGNPSKFLQAHNILGSDDLCGLVHAAVMKALTILGRTASQGNQSDWLNGRWKIKRVDLTYMYSLGSTADVRAWIRAAGEQGRMKYRGRGTFAGDTLYFGKVAKGKRASAWSLKLYCKADELRAMGKSHRLPLELDCRDDLLLWAEDKLRVELLMRTAELDRYDEGRFRWAKNWDSASAAQIFGEYFGKMELGENVMLPVELEEKLKPAMRLAYNAWKLGNDLRAILPHNTFYTYRRKILEMTEGEIDIAVLQAKSNVVPLRRVLTLRPAENPAFLADRPDLLFRRSA